MSSVKWLKPSLPEQAKWFREHMAKNYPGIHQKLISSNLNDKNYTQSFKDHVSRYWVDEDKRKVNIHKLRNAWDKKNSRNNKGESSLSIQISSDTKKIFSKLAKHKKLTQADFIAELISCYNQSKGQADTFQTTTSKQQEKSVIETLNLEIEKLKMELSEAKTNIKQLEKQIVVNEKSKSTNKKNIKKTRTKEEYIQYLIDNVPDRSSK